MEINHDLINIERGRALNAFTKLESYLCWILKEAGNLEHKTASIIFYSNTSFQPRIKIISAILEEFFENKFEIFWTSTCEILSSLNKQRNKIVHWHSYPVYNEKQVPEDTKFILLSPHMAEKDKFSELSTHNIREFIKKTNYVTSVLHIFRSCFDNANPAIQKYDIEFFSKHKLTYPTSKDDPFKKKLKSLNMQMNNQ